MKIEAKELEAALEAGRVRLVDVRTPAEFGELHIEGSELMPLDRLDADRLKGGGRECVIVCRSGKRAAQAREKLEAAGCERIRILEGGVQAWEQAGLPVKRGKAAVSLERQVRIAAGLLVLLGVTLGTFVHPGFHGIAAFVGAGLTFAGITDWCGMGMLLARAPWNQGAAQQSCSL
ncbi:rhodanese-like domain-containing protein [Akkermansiaceae bacterium]|nr:rhodanese-like domain-containing protein [Akkermansiaceae bacterium]